MFASSWLHLLVLTALSSVYRPFSEALTEGLINVDVTVSTNKLKETKEFYTKYLNFTILKETAGYISLSPGPGIANLDFVVEGADHACARPQLSKVFAGRGMFLTYNVGDVDAFCAGFNETNYGFLMPIRTEPWFERHCYVLDPNGIPLNLAHWNDTPSEPRGPSSMVFYYTSHNLTEINEWYTQNLNFTLTSDHDWVITLETANGTVSFRPFHPKNITYNPASFIPHLLEEFDGHGLSYTFNFKTSKEVDRWCHFLEDRGLTMKRKLQWVGSNKRCGVDDPNGVVINIATPGWNEYEEEVNCPPGTPTAAGASMRISGAAVCALLILTKLLDFH